MKGAGLPAAIAGSTICYLLFLLIWGCVDSGLGAVDIWKCSANNQENHENIRRSSAAAKVAPAIPTTEPKTSSARLSLPRRLQSSVGELPTSCKFATRSDSRSNLRNTRRLLEFVLPVEKWLSRLRHCGASAASPVVMLWTAPPPARECHG